jgi:hypothetical protein
MTDVTEQYTTSAFLTTLLRAISSAVLASLDPPGGEASKEPSNPLDNANLTTTARNILLTLHVLFPSQFLPALDILDRRLITRLVQQSSLDDQTSSRPPRSPYPALYLVGSAASHQSSSTSRFHDVIAPQFYEVRLLAWNCSCPAFAFAAFPPGVEDSVAVRDDEYAEWLASEDDELGQLLRRPARDSLPVCKHLLACVLVERV